MWFTFCCYWTTRAQTSPGSCSDPASLLRTHRVSPARPEVHQQLQKVPQASLSGRFTSRGLLVPHQGVLCCPLLAVPVSAASDPLLPTSPATLGSDAAPPLPTAPSLALSSRVAMGRKRETAPFQKKDRLWRKQFLVEISMYLLQNIKYLVVFLTHHSGLVPPGTFVKHADYQTSLPKILG